MFLSTLHKHRWGVGFCNNTSAMSHSNIFTFRSSSNIAQAMQGNTHRSGEKIYLPLLLKKAQIAMFFFGGYFVKWYENDWH